MHPYRPAKALPAVRRYETPAGKQAQMDWGICHYTDSSGTLHKVPAFVMILGKSRVKYTEFTSRCDLSSLERLIEDLKRALEQNRLERRWRVYLRPAVLVIDEVGYMQLNRQEAELFFRLVSERYEHGSIILTSNKYFSDWGELLSDTVIATALLDRLLHHAHVINIRGQTYRLKDRLKTGVQTVPPADIPAVE